MKYWALATGRTGSGSQTRFHHRNKQKTQPLLGDIEALTKLLSKKLKPGYKWVFIMNSDRQA